MVAEHPSTAPSARRALPGAAYIVIGDLITFRVTASQSGGRVVVVEALTPPGGGPPPLHSHPPDEIFTVLEGTPTLLRQGALGVERRRLGPGDTAHIPGGTPHTFRNFSDATTRFLATFVPGEMMEHYFVAGGIPAPPDSVPAIDVERQAEQAERILLVAHDVGMRLHQAPSDRHMRSRHD
jgi:quercetin dioxygenase-like cupin family protein